MFSNLEYSESKIYIYAFFKRWRVNIIIMGCSCQFRLVSILNPFFTFVLHNFITKYPEDVFQTKQGSESQTLF